MNKQKFVKYLWQRWELRNTAFDNLYTGAGHKLKAGHTCRFHKRNCNVEFTGTIMYSNSKCAYVVISNAGRYPCLTYLKDVYPVSTPVHWTEYYGELLKGIEDMRGVLAKCKCGNMPMLHEDCGHYFIGCPFCGERTTLCWGIDDAIMAWESLLKERYV